MVGQGLGRSVEAALEWRADYSRGEERVLYYMGALEASSKEEQAINKSSTYNSMRIPWRRRAAATTDMTLVQILGELVHPSGHAAWENSTT